MLRLGLKAILFCFCFYANPGGCLTLKTSDQLSLRLAKDGRVLGASVEGKPIPSGTTGGGFFVLDVATAKPAQRQLVPDPSFARGGEGWRLEPDWSLDTTLGHGDNRSARLNVPPPNRKISGNLRTTVPVRPNTSYEISIWMRTEKCEGVAPHVWIGQLEAEGQANVAPQITLSHGNVDSKGTWFPLTGSFTTNSQTQRLLIRAGLYGGTGTAWVDDVALTTTAVDYDGSAAPARGRLSPDGRFHADLKRQKLQLDARYQVFGDRVHVEGTLADTSGDDRPIMLFWRLPVDTSGGAWRWGQDLRHELPITREDRRYQNVRPLEAHQSISLYPFACLASPASPTSSGVGLSLSVPMDRPRVVRIGYDHRYGYWLVWDLGLSKVTSSFPQRATFAFDLFRFDPRWGFRAADRRYIDLFPQYFAKNFRDDGSWTGYEAYATPPEQHLPVHEGKDFDWIRWVDRPLDLNAKWEAYDYWNDTLSADDNAVGLIPYAYTEPSGYWDWRLDLRPDPKRKDLAPEQRIADLEELGRKNKRNAQYILRTSVRDRSGKMVTVWGYDMWHWECNPSPYLLDGSGQPNNIATQDWEEECVPRFKNYGCGCLYVDSGINCTRNYRREHFAAVRHPLTFDPDSLQLCIAEGFSAYEYLEWMRAKLDAEGKWMLVHWWGNEAATKFYGIHFGDTLGYEMIGSAPQEEQYLVARPLAYQKVVHTYSEFNRDTPRSIQEKYAKSDVFYGHFTDLLDKVLARNYTAMEREVSMAGWQPITGARGDNTWLEVERFGTPTEGNLHFTVRNRADTEQVANLLLDASDLGPAEFVRSDLYFQLLRTSLDNPRPQPVMREANGGAVKIPVTLPPGEVALIRVGTKRHLAAMRLPEITRQLEGAKRMLDYLATDPKATPASDLASGVEEAMKLARAPSLPQLTNQVAEVWALSARRSPSDRRVQQVAFMLAEAMRVASEALEAQHDLILPADTSLVTQPLNYLRDPIAVMRGGEFTVPLPDGAKCLSVADDGLTVEPRAAEATVRVAAGARAGLHPLAWEWTLPVEGQNTRLWRTVDFRVVESPLTAQLRPLRLLRKDTRQQMTVVLTGLTDQSLTGSIELTTPPGWQMDATRQPFVLPPRGMTRVAFSVKTGVGMDETTPVKLRVSVGESVALEQTEPVSLASNRPTLVVRRVPSPPKLDGVVDDEAWRKCEPVGALRLPEGIPATQQSTIRAAYDDKALYVAYLCTEADMAKITATLTGVGGAVWNDDCVEIYVKPGHRALCHFAANTLGGRFMRGANDSWQSAAKRSDDGWTIEVALPFSAMQEPAPLPGEIWGANFCREEKPHREDSCWSLPGFNDENGLGDLVFE